MPARRSRKITNTPKAPKSGSGSRTTLVVVLLAFVAVLAYLGYAGLFSAVTVTEAESGPYALMLQAQKGDYKQTPATIEAVKRAAESVGIESEAACGIFFDNPREVETGKLRAQVGLVISPKDRAKVRRLPAAISYKLMPKEKRLVAEFPFRTKLSVRLGIMRVYPAMAQAAAARKLERVPFLEIYREHESITYLMQIVPAKPAKAARK